MDLLVDTCTALWYWSGDPRLSARAEEALRDPANEVWFHQVSYLEITLKYSLGKLSLSESPTILVPKALETYRFQYSALSNPDIATLETLPFHHRDPFDRLLISRALNRDWTIVTSDSAFPAYAVNLLW
jgi:PIN domain nuclease of toxin-antitoxin system